MDTTPPSSSDDAKPWEVDHSPVEFPADANTIRRKMSRNLALLAQLDGWSEELKGTIENESETYFDNIATYTDNERKEKLYDIQMMHLKLQSFADQKMAVAKELNEMCNKSLSDFDAEERKEKEKLMQQLGQNLEFVNNDNPVKLLQRKTISPQQKKKKKKEKKEKKEKKKKKKKKEKKEKKKKQKKQKKETKEKDGEGSSPEMPFDSDEPTWCLCHDVSHGVMIACDGPACPTEWFHIKCIGLKAVPKHKWFCSDCHPSNTALPIPKKTE